MPELAAHPKEVEAGPAPADGSEPDVRVPDSGVSPGDACVAERPLVARADCDSAEGESPFDAGDVPRSACEGGCELGSPCTSDDDCSSRVCSTGSCRDCRPGENGCLSITPRTCSALGQWVYAASCIGDTVCVAETGACGCLDTDRICGGVDTDSERRCIDDKLVSVPCGIGLSCTFDGCRAEWLDQLGTSSSDVARALWVDAGGSVVVAGSTRGVLAGAANAGQSDIFVRRYDPHGIALWTTQFGSFETEFPVAVAADEVGNVIVAGTIGGLFAGPVAGGQAGAFVAKLDPNGVVSWTRQFGTSDDDFPSALRLDADGNILVAGPPLALGGPDTSNGYLIKFDGEGSELWARTIPELATVRTIELAGANDVLIASVTASTLPGAARSGVKDVVVMQYDASGERVGARQFPADFGTERSGLTALDVDGAGQVTLAGTDILTVPDDELTGEPDVFVQRYDAQGLELWSRMLGTPAFDRVEAISLDEGGNVWVAGHTEGVISGQNFVNSGRDIFVTMYDATGTSWTRQFRTSGNDDVTALGTNASGRVFIAGSTESRLPGRTNAGSDDAIVIEVGTSAAFSGPTLPRIERGTRAR